LGMAFAWQESAPGRRDGLWSEDVRAARA
jgi:hypothetical protein